MTTQNVDKILVLAPHTDDGEFGCGASITKWIEEGKIVYYATFSACKQSYHRQELLDDLIKLREKLQPDLVIMPSLNDIHQDHKTIAEEGLRAFKFFSILCYEMPWNNLVFNTTCFNTLEKKHVDKKVAALKLYKSQAHRPYSNPAFIEGLALNRGIQINAEFAEVFEVLRWKI
jgi:LmbE family N-acetylglucosaminyl deacetylase